MPDARFIDYQGKVLLGSRASQKTLFGTSGADNLIGTAADESFYNFNGAKDLFAGGAGDDVYNVSWSSAIKVIETANSGIDTIKTTSSSFVLPEHVENLYLIGQVYKGGMTGIGNDAANVIISDANAHTIDGRAGNDILTGGGGGDTFIFQKGSGHDVITDFRTGADGDKITIENSGFKSFADVKAAMTQVGADVVLKLSATDDVLLSNTKIADFKVENVDLELNLDGMKLTFSQEFSDSKLDLYDFSTGKGTWVTAYGWNGWDSKMSHTLSINGEKQLYVDPLYKGTGSKPLGLNPFKIKDGVLDINATNMPDAAKKSMFDMEYASGLLSTRMSFTQTYGYFEINAKMSDVEGAWPAFWLFGATSGEYAEIDVFEVKGSDPNVINTTFHVDTAAPSGTTGSTAYVADAATNFHRYGVMWDKNYLTYYIDGREVWQKATPANFDGPMYMIVNMAVGGWAGSPVAGDFKATMQVDYVRAYSLANAPVSGDTGSPAPSTTPMPVPVFDLVGTSGIDNLKSTADTKTMSGLGGNDTYQVNHTGVKIVEVANGGTDSVLTLLESYELADNVENLTFSATGSFVGTGNALANVIKGGAGNDKLDGAAGADTLEGDAGDDIYFVDNTNDAVLEKDGQGYDIVYVSAQQYTLKAEQSIEKMIGTGAANSLTGNKLANEIVGTAGINVIDGGAGADVMRGLAGNDTYVVDHASDVVIEALNEGWDTLKTSLSNYTLTDNVEVLTFTGTSDFRGTGNALANQIYGNGGNDVLDGIGGADCLFGGKGNDTYFVRDVSVAVVEKAGEGRDTIMTTVSSLKAVANVEVLKFIGTGKFTGYANASGTELHGAAGGDWLFGDVGSDILVGGLGSDMMRGGAGADTFVFNTLGKGVDRVVDFQVGLDRLAFSAADLGVNSLKNITLINGPHKTAIETGPSLIYDAGKLYFHAGPTADQDPVLVATFDNRASLAMSDLMLL